MARKPNYDAAWTKKNKAKKSKPNHESTQNSVRNLFGRFDDSQIKVALYLSEKENLYPTIAIDVDENLAKYKKNYEFRGVGFYKDQSPQKIYTPQTKTQLSHKRKMPFGNIYTNAPEQKYSTVEKIENSHLFFSSKTYQQIRTPDTNIKSKNFTLTKDQLKKVTQEKQKNSQKRSQNKVMSMTGNIKQGSATAYVRETQHFDLNVKWEYAHLIAHQFGGEETQHPDNLVITTEAANTEMITLENAIKWLVLHKFPEGIQLSVEANLIPDTQIAIQVNYKINAPGFSFTHSINAQNPNKPNLSENDLMMIMSRILTSEKKLETHEKPIVQDTSPLVLN